MKVLGILGGTGPQSTNLFYNQLIKICQKEKNSQYPPIIINSVSLWKVVKMLDNKKELIKFLLKELKKIERHVDFLAIPCNGLHFILEDLRKRLKVPLLGIHEEVSKEISKFTFKKIGVLGTKATIKNNFYKEIFKKYDLEYVGLEDSEEDELNEIIFNEILPGKERKNIKKFLLNYVEKLRKKGCDAVVLACTELPLFISQEDTKIRIFSSTDILAKSCIKKIFS